MYESLLFSRMFRPLVAAFIMKTITYLRKMVRDILLYFAVVHDSVTLIDLAFKVFKHPAGSKENSVDAALISACLEGHLGVVKHLVEKYEIDVHKSRTGEWPVILNINDDRDPNANGTALHAATRSGNTQLVDYLVKVCNVDVNATTREAEVVEEKYKMYHGSTTALHLAVVNLFGHKRPKRYEMVGCLLRNGVDWNICDDFGKQCWELTDDVDLTKLMISFGVGLNASRNSTLSNIAHKWAMSKDRRSFEVLDFADSQGVDLNLPNVKRLTPLMGAAFGHESLPNEKVFKFLLRLWDKKITRLEKILAYELAGASFIVWGKKEKGLKYWKKAMGLRFGIEPPISKPKPPNSFRLAFKDVSEAQTLQELDALEHLTFFYSPEPTIHAFLTYLRILGPNYSDTFKLFSIPFAAILKINQQHYIDCTKVMLESCKPMNSSIWEVCYPVILSYILVIAESNKKTFLRHLNNFDNTMPILRILVDILKQMSGSAAHSKTEQILDVITILVDLMIGSVKLNSPEGLQLKCFLNEAVRLNIRDEDGHDLLLTACMSIDDHVSYDSSLHEDTCLIRLPESLSPDLISLLLEVGADPNSTNIYGDTALHIVAECCEACHPEKVSILLKAGTHIDQKNRWGETATDLNENIVPPKIPLLQCLCARVVDQSNDSLFEELPLKIVEFIKLH